MSGPPPPYPGMNEAYPPPEKFGYAPPQPGAPTPTGYPTQPAYPPPPPGTIHPPGYGPTPAGYGPPMSGYGPPPPGYGPPPPMGQPGHTTTTVIVQPPIAVRSLGDMPIQMRCPKCNADIVTSVHYESGTLAWILCLILCFFGFIFGCCLIPFCIESSKDVLHTCPNCHQTLGRYNRM